MASGHDNAFIHFALAESKRHAAYLRGLPFDPKTDARFVHLAAESIAEQRRIEAADKVDFETFRRNYLSPELLRI
jgi:glutamate--cysteine ligase